MKKWILVFLSGIIGLDAYTQSDSHALGVHLSALDFWGPQTGQYFFVENSVSKNNIYWEPAFQISYHKFFSKHFDFRTQLTMSSVLMPFRSNDTFFQTQKNKSKTNTSSTEYRSYFFSIDENIIFSILPKNEYIITPQLHSGIGYYFQKYYSGSVVNAGLGANVLLAKSLSLQLNSAYHFSLTNKNQNYLMHSFGLVYGFGKKKEKAEKTLQKKEKEIPVTITTKEETNLIADKDNDGVPDADDRCVDIPGRKEMKGCPDKDKDGIPDMDDHCPDTKGVATAAGCPDADADGVEDDKDKCPALYAQTNDGCPEPEKPIVPQVSQSEYEKVTTAAKSVLFNSGTAYLIPSAYAALDTIVSVLKKDANLYIDIEGHTDNTGDEKVNLVLSQQRANACMEFLVKHGIAEERISAIGYGDMKPVESNETPEGRSANRRTEFLLYYPKTGEK